MVPRSRRGARALSVLGWQGLVRSNLAQSKRTSANPGPGRSWYAGAGWPDRTSCIRSARTAGIRPAWSVAVRAGVRQRLRELSGDSEEEVARWLVDRRWRA